MNFVVNFATDSGSFTSKRLKVLFVSVISFSVSVNVVILFLNVINVLLHFVCVGLNMYVYTV